MQDALIFGVKKLDLKFSVNYAKISKDFISKGNDCAGASRERLILFSERGNHRLKVPLR